MFIFTFKIRLLGILRLHMWTTLFLLFSAALVKQSHFHCCYPRFFSDQWTYCYEKVNWVFILTQFIQCCLDSLRYKVLSLYKTISLFLKMKTIFFFFFFFFFFDCAHGMWKFLGQRSNPHHSGNQWSYAISLSHCSTWKLLKSPFSFEGYLESIFLQGSDRHSWTHSLLKNENPCSIPDH